MARRMLLAALLVIGFAAASRASSDDQLPSVNSSAPNVAQSPVDEIRRIVNSEMTNAQKAFVLRRYVDLGEAVTTVEKRLGRPSHVIVYIRCDLFIWSEGDLALGVRNKRVVSIGSIAKGVDSLRQYQRLAHQEEDSGTIAPPHGRSER
jgi:hypothetical protein